jgi:hypothetical protein
MLYVNKVMEHLCSIGQYNLTSQNITWIVLEIHAKGQNEAHRQKHLRITSVEDESIYTTQYEIVQNFPISF